MKPTDIHADDFYLTGAVETSLVYLATPFIAGAASVQDTGMFLFEDGFGTGYVGKKGATNAKDEWVALSSQELQQRFEDWQKKWRDSDDEIYALATSNKPSEWRAAWKQIDHINYDFWFDSYKLDSLDPFAEELESKVQQGLTKAAVDTELLSEIVAPEEQTLPQQMETLLSEVAAKGLTRESYVRRFWFKKGTWNGGTLYTDEDLTQELATSVSPEGLQEALSKRKALHKEVDPRLDEETMRLVVLLRTFTLWREMRKSFSQRLSLALKQITADAADEFGIDAKLIRWAQLDEIDTVVQDPEILKERMRKSVYLMKGEEQTIFLGDEAQHIFDAFKHDGELTEVRGMVAAKGSAQGIVRVVLKESEFSSFQEGEILVTTMTRPEFVPLMRRAAAIITEAL